SGDLLPHVLLRLAALGIEPGRQVAMLGVLHDEVVARAGGVGFDEAIEHAERPRLSRQELSEVRLAQPPRDLKTDLDAYASRERRRRRRHGEINLPESAFADQAVQPVAPPGLVAVHRGQHRTRLDRRAWPGCGRLRPATRGWGPPLPSRGRSQYAGSG